MTTATDFPPWAVASMPTVWLRACDPLGLAHSMRPISATRHPAEPADGDALHYGQLLWGGRSQQGDVALAWDWVELPQRVIALADPMQVLSNIQLELEDGSWMNERHRILWLNDLIAALPWQAGLAGEGSHLRGTGDPQLPLAA